MLLHIHTHFHLRPKLQQQSVLARVYSFVVNHIPKTLTVGLLMAERDVGSARRRRKRRLRSWLRHERMTVRMELAAALHHAAFKGARDARRFTKPEDGQLQGGSGVLRGLQPTGLVEPRGPLEGVLQDTVGTPTRSVPSCRFSMLLCCRWGTSCRTSCNFFSTFNA